MVNEQSKESKEKCNGEWIKYPVDVAEHPHHCSKCGWSNFIIDRYVRYFNFCPGCGAEMNVTKE